MYFIDKSTKTVIVKDKNQFSVLGSDKSEKRVGFTVIRGFSYRKHFMGQIKTNESDKVSVACLEGRFVAVVLYKEFI